MRKLCPTLYIFIAVTLATVPKVRAQADISIATYYYNRGSYNPASIARVDYLYLFSNAHLQWTGVKGAPRVFNVQVSGYNHEKRSALGLSIIGDKIGVIQTLNPMLAYAYRASHEQDWAFSMGLSAGIFSRSVSGALYEADEIVDPSIQYTMEKSILPDANIGFEFQNNHFVFSLSSTHLFSMGKSDNLYLNANHRYISAFYKNTNPELFNYHVGLMVINRDNLVTLQGSAYIRFKYQTGLISGPREIFEVGTTYSTSRYQSLLLGLYVSQDFRIAYSFNQTFNQGYSKNGTHEITLEYRIPQRSAFANYYRRRGYWYN
ncbi:MAG: PorP/SprF family type IX secretion system membrane protein [Bacteroidota bacterium]|nr:PorP/SprF family type IX secretion system membrane protein [Bacteroidota bacterium]